MSICDQIAGEFGQLFSCSTVNRHVRIRTPFLYPDGDVIDVFYRLEGEMVIISDLGETTRWLRSQTPSMRKTFKQKQLILDICAANEVEFFRGSLNIRANAGANIAQKVNQLVQAIIRVSDIWLTFRTKSSQSFADEVAEFLQEKNISFERNDKLPGRSGRAYTVDFHTFHENRGGLVNVLSTGSKAYANMTAERTLACWYDLSYLKSTNLRFISLFDDSFDVWTAEDFRLVSGLSETAVWSKPEEFVELLTAA